MLTHRNLLMACLSHYADVDPVGPGEAILHAAPMSHGSGIIGLGFVAQAGNNIVPESASFDPAEIATLLRRWSQVSLFAAPTMVTRLVNNPVFASADHPGLKTIVYGGGPMHVEDLVRALDAIGPRLAQLYGQGKSPMTITALAKWLHTDRSRPRWREIMASVGAPRTDVEVKVFDAEDRELPTGEIGEVVCRGDVVMAVIPAWADLRPKSMDRCCSPSLTHAGQAKRGVSHGRAIWIIADVGDLPSSSERAIEIDQIRRDLRLAVGEIIFALQ